MATAIRGGVVSDSPSEPCAWPTFEEDVRKAKNAFNAARRATETMARGTIEEVRKHPLRAAGLAIFTGAMTGALIGFGAGWFARNRRR
jgi:hypothetical protein